MMVGYAFPEVQAFVTGPSSSTLVSIQLSAGSWSVAPADHFLVSICCDVSNRPGTTLVTLVGPDPPLGLATNYTYIVPEPGTILAAQTKYWVVASSTSTNGPYANYFWKRDGASWDYTANDGWTLGNNGYKNGSQDWTILNFPQMLLAINVINVSRPLSAQMANGAYNLSLLTVSNQSYTVQNNTDLTTTNWISLTNFVGDGATKSIAAAVVDGPQFFRTTTP